MALITGVINEEWRSINGYINYQVSNIGRVRNANTGRIMRQVVNWRGYCAVYLRVGNHKSTKTVHRLVAQEFIETDNNNLYVDHINHNKTDNCVSNLRWVSNQQNSMNQIKTKSTTSSKYKGVSFFKRDHTWAARVRKGKSDSFLGYFPNEKEAARAYNDKAIELFEEYASLNEISDNE